MPDPTTSWFCDTCRDLIDPAYQADPDEGWVEWIRLPGSPSEPPRCRDIRIVHHRQSCQFNSYAEDQRDGGSIADAPLVDFQGPDGLMRLLEMLSEQQLPTGALLEIIKRIHIPGYEHARRHFPKALAEGILEHNVADGFWWQEDLQRVIDFAHENE